MCFTISTSARKQLAAEMRKAGGRMTFYKKVDKDGYSPQRWLGKARLRYRPGATVRAKPKYKQWRSKETIESLSGLSGLSKYAVARGGIYVYTDSKIAKMGRGTLKARHPKGERFLEVTAHVDDLLHVSINEQEATFRKVFVKRNQ